MFDAVVGVPEPVQAVWAALGALLPGPGPGGAAVPGAAGLAGPLARLAGCGVPVPPGRAGQRAAELAVLLACRHRLDAVLAGRLADADRAGLAEAAGAGSLRRWLVAATGVSAPEAGRLVGLAATCRDHPAVAAALAAGRVGSEQARLVGRTLAQLPAATVPAATDLLVEQATGRDPEDLHRRVAVPLLDRLRPEVAHAEPETLRAARRLYCARTFHGMVDLHGLLDPATGEAVLAALGPLAAPLPEETRTAAQRRADALAELCRRATSPTAGPTGGPTGAGRAPAEVLLVLPATALAAPATDPAGWATGDAGQPPNPSPGPTPAWLPGAAPGPAPGSDRPPGAAPARPRWSRTGDVDWVDLATTLCGATWARLVLDPTGQPVNLGRRTRTWTPAQRRALTQRDQHCTWPGCRRPAADCDIDHIIPWQAGGPTDLANGRLLCPYHHQLRHDGWTLHGTHGAWTVTPPPDWAHRQHRRRRRNPRHPPTRRLLAA